MRSTRPRTTTSTISASPDPGRRRLLAGAAALGGAALAGCTAGETTLSSDATHPTGQFITVEGVRLHYHVTGKGPKAVAIHGASGNLRDWALGPADTLGRSNTVLMFDRPGLGFSDRPAQGGDDPFVQARLMRRAAAELGFGAPLLIGHSYGGAVALAWALDAPDAVPGMLLIAAPSQVWPGGVGLLYDLTGNPVTGPLFSRVLPAFASDGLIESALERIFAPQEPPAGYAAAVGARLALRPETLRANAADIARLKGHIRGMVPRYAGLAMPAEILHGTEDKVVPLSIHSEELVRQMPAARLIRLQGIGHMPHHVATDAVAAALGRLNAQL